MQWLIAFLQRLRRQTLRKWQVALDRKTVRRNNLHDFSRTRIGIVYWLSFQSYNTNLGFKAKRLFELCFANFHVQPFP